MTFPAKMKTDQQCLHKKHKFVRVLYELYTGKKTIVSEIFGRHPSDQYKEFDAFTSHTYIHTYKTIFIIW